MTSKTSEQSIKRLLLKCARYIGHYCFKYISNFLDQDKLTAFEMEILERILTMGLYTDEVIEAACGTALEGRISNIIDFNFLVCEKNNSLQENTE